MSYADTSKVRTRNHRGRGYDLQVNGLHAALLHATRAEHRVEVGRGCGQHAAVSFELFALARLQGHIAEDVLFPQRVHHLGEGRGSLLTNGRAAHLSYTVQSSISSNPIHSITITLIVAYSLYYHVTTS